MIATTPPRVLLRTPNPHAAHQHDLRKGVEQRRRQVGGGRRGIVLVDEVGDGVEEDGRALEVLGGNLQAIVGCAVGQRANLALQRRQVEEDVDALKVDVDEFCKG